MKKIAVQLILAMVLGIIVSPNNLKANIPDKEQKNLVIYPSELKIQVGQTLEFKVKYTTENNEMVQEKCAWQVAPDSLGNFHGAKFEAMATGNGKIIATYKNYSDTISVYVYKKSDDTKDNGDNKEREKYPKIDLEKNSAALRVGETFQVVPTYWLTKDSLVDVAFTYTLNPLILGSLNTEGVFTASHPGNGIIIVSYNNVASVVKIIVRSEHNDKEQKYPRLEIVTRGVNIQKGDFVELMCVYADSIGDVNRITPYWSVEPAFLGHFSDSLFNADSLGKGYLVAEYKGLTDRIPLIVKEAKQPENEWRDYRFVIEPSDTTVAIGHTIQYGLKVYNKKDLQVLNDLSILNKLSVSWSVEGREIGEITNNGLFTATKKGFGLIKAKINNQKAITTRLFVDETITDSTGLNTVNVQRVLPNGRILPSKLIMEGCAYHFKGLPFPLNILNNGLLYFPVGSLKENITIFMMLPEQIREDSTKVIHTDSVVAGIKFIVAARDSIIEPYYFDKPLILSIPYRTDLLDSLGIEPEEIGLFFTENGNYTESGIENIVIDTVKNRIIAEVVHFSSLVIRKNNATGLNVKQMLMPENTIVAIAPNPFVDYTNINFSIKGEKDITYYIYDLSGKLINSFALGKINGKYSFNWNAKNLNGQAVKPGIYIGQIYENGKRSGVNKMIKLGLQ